MRANERRSSVSSNGPPGGRTSLSGARTSIGGFGATGRTSIGASGGRASIGASGARNSLGQNASAGVSGIPRAGMSRISAVRTANHQPAFDFLTGTESNIARPGKSINDENEGVKTAERDRELSDLKAELKTLKYTMSTREQEVELAKIRQEAEMRDVRRKGEEDFKKMQAAEGERLKAVRLHESVGKELQRLRDEGENEKAAMEKQLRDIEEEKRLLREDVEDVKAESEEANRGLERRLKELEERNKLLSTTAEEMRSATEENVSQLESAQQQLVQRDSEVGQLEAEVLKLKAQSGDADTLGVIKRELSEQVTHIRTLEATNREHLAELKHLRRLHKSVEVVEEEKRSLQRKVDGMESLQHDLDEAILQRQRLEDERLSWTAYLQSQTREGDQLEFDTPEDLAKALVHERLQSASFLESRGILEAAVTEKEEIIQTLESDKIKIQRQLEKARDSGGGDAKARSRLERQKALAIKEVDLLRAQLQTYDTEEMTMEIKNFDEQKVQRISQLESLVDEYKKELQVLHEELSTAQIGAPPGEILGLKRPREETADTEHLGQLSRKNRKLQDELSAAQTTSSTLQKELSVAQKRLKAANEQNKTRVLSLRSNPTSDAEAIKLATLTALKSENAALLSQLQTGRPGTAVVPMATLESAQREVKEMAGMVADKEKAMRRLKEIWGAKSLEFREAINSLIGWETVFLPNGKYKVSSLFYPKGSGGEEENSIIFDGERGTMKISGGAHSAFALKISDQIKFWVKERGEIPCLLAALTLEFYEESTRAAAH